MQDLPSEYPADGLSAYKIIPTVFLYVGAYAAVDVDRLLEHYVVDVVAGLLLAFAVVRASRYWSLPIGRDRAR